MASPPHDQYVHAHIRSQDHATYGSPEVWPKSCLCPRCVHMNEPVKQYPEVTPPRGDPFPQVSAESDLLSGAQVRTVSVEPTNEFLTNWETLLPEVRQHSSQIEKTGTVEGRHSCTHSQDCECMQLRKTSTVSTGTMCGHPNDTYPTSYIKITEEPTPEKSPAEVPDKVDEAPNASEAWRLSCLSPGDFHAYGLVSPLNLRDALCSPAEYEGSSIHLQRSDDVIISTLACSQSCDYETVNKSPSDARNVACPIVRAQAQRESEELSPLCTTFNARKVESRISGHLSNEPRTRPSRTPLSAVRFSGTTERKASRLSVRSADPYGRTRDLLVASPTSFQSRKPTVSDGVDRDPTYLPHCHLSRRLSTSAEVTDSEQTKGLLSHDSGTQQKTCKCQDTSPCRSPNCPAPDRRDSQSCVATKFILPEEGALRESRVRSVHDVSPTKDASMTQISKTSNLPELARSKSDCTVTSKEIGGQTSSASIKGALKEIGGKTSSSSIKGASKEIGGQTSSSSIKGAVSFQSGECLNISSTKMDKPTQSSPLTVRTASQISWNKNIDEHSAEKTGSNIHPSSSVETQKSGSATHLQPESSPSKQCLEHQDTSASLATPTLNDQQICKTTSITTSSAQGSTRPVVSTICLSSKPLERNDLSASCGQLGTTFGAMSGQPPLNEQTADTLSKMQKERRICCCRSLGVLEIPEQIYKPLESDEQRTDVSESKEQMLCCTPANKQSEEETIPYQPSGEIEQMEEYSSTPTTMGTERTDDKGGQRPLTPGRIEKKEGGGSNDKKMRATKIKRTTLSRERSLALFSKRLKQKSPKRAQKDKSTKEQAESTEHLESAPGEQEGSSQDEEKQPTNPEGPPEDCTTIKEAQSEECVESVGSVEDYQKGYIEPPSDPDISNQASFMYIYQCIYCKQLMYYPVCCRIDYSCSCSCPLSYPTWVPPCPCPALPCPPPVPSPSMPCSSPYPQPQPCGFCCEYYPPTQPCIQPTPSPIVYPTCQPCYPPPPCNQLHQDTSEALDPHSEKSESATVRSKTSESSSKDLKPVQAKQNKSQTSDSSLSHSKSYESASFETQTRSYLNESKTTADTLSSRIQSQGPSVKVEPCPKDCVTNSCAVCEPCACCTYYCQSHCDMFRVQDSSKRQNAVSESSSQLSESQSRRMSSDSCQVTVPEPRPASREKDKQTSKPQIYSPLHDQCPQPCPTPCNPCPVSNKPHQTSSTSEQPPTDSEQNGLISKSALNDPCQTTYNEQWLCCLPYGPCYPQVCALPCDPCALPCDPCALPCDPCALPCDPCALPCDPCALPCDPCALPCDPYALPCDPCALPCNLSEACSQSCPKPHDSCQKSDTQEPRSSDQGQDIKPLASQLSSEPCSCQMSNTRVDGLAGREPSSQPSETCSCKLPNTHGDCPTGREPDPQPCKSKQSSQLCPEQPKCENQLRRQSSMVTNNSRDLGSATKQKHTRGSGSLKKRLRGNSRKKCVQNSGPFFDSKKEKATELDSSEEKVRSRRPSRKPSSDGAPAPSSRRSSDGVGEARRKTKRNPRHEASDDQRKHERNMDLSTGAHRPVLILPSRAAVQAPVFPLNTRFHYSIAKALSELKRSKVPPRRDISVTPHHSSSVLNRVTDKTFYPCQSRWMSALFQDPLFKRNARLHSSYSAASGHLLRCVQLSGYPSPRTTQLTHRPGEDGQRQRLHKSVALSDSVHCGSSPTGKRLTGLRMPRCDSQTSCQRSQSQLSEESQQQSPAGQSQARSNCRPSAMETLVLPPPRYCQTAPSHQYSGPNSPGAKCPTVTTGGISYSPVVLPKSSPDRNDSNDNERVSCHESKEKRRRYNYSHCLHPPGRPHRGVRVVSYKKAKRVLVTANPSLLSLRRIPAYHTKLHNVQSSSSSSALSDENDTISYQSDDQSSSSTYCPCLKRLGGVCQCRSTYHHYSDDVPRNPPTVVWCKPEEHRYCQDCGGVISTFPPVCSGCHPRNNYPSRPLGRRQVRKIRGVDRPMVLRFQRPLRRLLLRSKRRVSETATKTH